MQRTFTTPEPVSLYVELGSGELVLTAGETTETVVDVDGKNAEDVVVDQRGDEILVVAKSRSAGFFGSSHDLTVRVLMPTDSRLSTKLGSADVRAEGRLGETMLKTGSGDVAAAALGSGSPARPVPYCCCNSRLGRPTPLVAIGTAAARPSPPRRQRFGHWFRLIIVLTPASGNTEGQCQGEQRRKPPNAAAKIF